MFLLTTGRESIKFIVEQEADMPVAYADSRAANPKIKIDAKITNPTQKHGLSWGGAYIDFDFKVDLNCNVSADILGALGSSPSYELFNAYILPGIYVKGVADLSFYGSVDARLVEDVHLGFHYENSAARLTRNFKKDSFTVTANATAKAGVKMEAGFKIPGLDGKIYSRMGVTITGKSVHYTDGKNPSVCQTISSYFYASVGYDVSVDILGYRDSLFADNKDIYTQFNSPVKTAFHYEDGKSVKKCTRGTPGMGYGGWGYFSPVNSQYYYDVNSSGSTYGDGEVYTIFDYTLNEDNQATITKYRGTAVNVFVPDTLDGYAVVGIGDNAFKDNKRIKSVSIADSVETIGSSAFYGGSALERVGFPENEKFVEIQSSTFYGCARLSEVEIPDSVTVIGSWAFANCMELSSVKLPKKLEEMGGMAFGDCDKITRIEIPKSLKECGGGGVNGPFANCDELKDVTFESRSTEIATGLFCDCTGLEEIIIPETVTVVEAYAFRNCSNLKEVVFSKNLTEIQYWAFWGCGKIEKVEIPDSVTKIGGDAFRDCTSIKEAIIPDSVTSIGDYTFSGCTSLEKVHIPNTQKTITKYMFNECNSLREINLPETLTEIQDHAFYNCDALTELNLPSQVKTIGSNAFYDCDAMTRAAIPSTVTDMKSYAFYHCDSLAEVSLGIGLTSLSSYAFAQCPKLTNIVLPYRMTKIDDNAFNACTGLTEITLPRGMAEIGNQVFSYPGKMTIYGIKGTYAEKYANDNGITFVNREVKAENVELNQTSIKVGKGYKTQLFLTVTPESFTDEVVWKSGDTDIATVTEDGEIRGVSCGTTTVKVTVGNASATCNVTVTQPVTSISLSKRSEEMAAGDKLVLTAEVYPNDATDKRYRWSSSDPSIAIVNEQGEVTALAKGEAVIMATALDGSEVVGRCTINIISQIITVATIEELQSSHPYENNCLDSWQYTLNGAESINVRFNEQTEMEDGFDYIYLYYKSNKLIGTYTGKQLAGKTIRVPGDTIRIKLETDKGGSAWGFQVDSVTEASGSGTEEPEEPATAYTYELNSDNTITIIKCTSSDENIIIPSEIDGYTVVGIGDKAFNNITSMKTVSLPSTLKMIGDSAFEGCTSLTTIKGGKGSCAEEYASKNGYEFVEIKDDNTGDDNTGDDNTGDDNTGDDNTGDDNTGDNTNDETFLAGDVDCNKAVNLDDAKIVLRLAVGIKPQNPVSEQGKKNADYDKSGKIDLKDATYNLKTAVGIKFTLPK